MDDNRRFDVPCDTTSKASLGELKSYGSQYRHDESQGDDEPIGDDPNSMGHSPSWPEDAD